ncbi:MAG: hypothetical protein KBS34_04205, partial [Phascolarctobacterium sp.]|nr:hypothetical protein [Candidatus Phascolarctobacterium equi]
GLARVEAATVALIPLINKVEFQTVEQEKVPNMIYMNQALAVLKNKPGYMLVENDRLRHAIKDNIDPYKLPTKEQMQTVSKKGNVDIIFAMVLTDYDYISFNESGSTRMIKMNVKANLVSYNRLTGKYVIKKCVDESEMDETFTSRWDVCQESWIKMVKQEFDRITRFKKK